MDQVEPQNNNPRSVLERLEGCERPPVDHCVNCSHVYNMEEAAFTRGLKVLFIIILTATVIELTVSVLWLSERFCFHRIRWERMVPLVIFATGVMACCVMETMRKSSSPKRGQVRTI